MDIFYIIVKLLEVGDRILSSLLFTVYFYFNIIFGTLFLYILENEYRMTRNHFY